MDEPYHPLHHMYCQIDWEYPVVLCFGTLGETDDDHPEILLWDVLKKLYERGGHRE